MKKTFVRNLTILIAFISMVSFWSCQEQQSKQTEKRYVDSWMQDTITQKWGYVLHSGDTLIPFQYDSIQYPHHAKITAVSLEGKWGIVDKTTGEEILPCSYDYFKDNNIRKDIKQTLMVKQAEKWGVVELLTGKEIAPCIYDEIFNHNINTGDFSVRLGDKSGTMNTEGEFIKPLSKIIPVVTTRYLGEKVVNNQTTIVSFVLRTQGDIRTVNNFSFKVESALGAGEGALSRSKSFSVATSKELELSPKGIYQDDKIEIALKSKEAVCSIINDGQKYTCSAKKVVE